ncbi:MULTISPECIES: DUF1223 domain-containing protein [Kordiimonas]|jgi:hypothetical protein|uniref:DUF1223 domain-containing protein n=1 Tax=Kordiimonas lacus TaxID=637679 RepID=A0A1G6TW26_9PROT|nr:MULTISPECIES: DUF1223 domain-containing protein [Kordiimonas]SDD33259.1 hypothetical protein SAMN04488071_0380 [Kordiimonas lacus]
MKNWFKILFSSALLLGLQAASVQADDAKAPRLTVIELFTSQGCSSCPPADAALKSLRGRPGILTLSWPVDYWDRLGWEDTFAHPHNAVRQAAYNKRLGRGGVFTPQMILDGRIQCVGSKPEKVRMSIEKARAVERPVINPTLAEAPDGKLQLTLPAADVGDMVSVRVVWFLSDATVQIGDGENQGRSLHYTNVVRASDILMDWKGDAAMLTLDPADGLGAGADHVAILLQDDYGHGPIVGAVSAPLKQASTTVASAR